MKVFQDTDRVKNGIREAITLLCKSGLSFQSEMSIDGLLGITLDQNEVFLVSIQEVIKNSADYCVNPNITTTPEYHGQNMFESLESCHSHLEDGAGHSSISKRSKRKRLLTKAYRPLVNLSPSRSSEIDTDDSTNVYYNDGVCNQKKHHPSYEPLHGQEDNDENNEPLSLVVRKRPCDYNAKEVSDCKLDVRQDDTSAYPTDLRVHQVDVEDSTPNNTHSQQNSIKQTPLADNFSDTQTQRSDQSDTRPILKPKTNSRKSKVKPKRILPVERNRPDDNDNQSLSSPSGSHSPPLATSQRSTPDDSEEPSKLTVKVENSDSVEEYCVNSDQTCEPNSTFTNVYESGIPVTSEELSSCKKDGIDVKDKILDGIMHGTHDNPWGTIFDPDSHAKWLQSIAAYVQGPVKSAAFVPPLAHHCLPFVGGTLPNPKLSVPQATKPQVTCVVIIVYTINMISLFVIVSISLLSFKTA